MNNSIILYPLKFSPIFQYRIWGGNQLKKFLNKKITEDSIGESWEISTVRNEVSEVSEGNLKGKNLNELVEIYKHDLVGTEVYKRFSNEFPLLIKFINSEDVLSVQVHPDDEFAKLHHNSFGKNEMWYILDVQEDSELIIGFNENVTKEIYEQKLLENDLGSILRTIKPKVGEVYFIPNGRVHAIGKNIILAEIQQTSDVTYRIFDYNRTDKDGKTRELHNDLAKQVVDLNFVDNPANSYVEKTNELVDLELNDYFKTQKLHFNKSIHLNFDLTSFTILMQIKGNSTLNYNNIIYNLNLGETILIPAICTNFKLSTTEESQVLVVRI